MRGSRPKQVRAGQVVRGRYRTRPRRALLLGPFLAAALLLGGAAPAAPQTADTLTRARMLYNVGEYDQAIEAADKALAVAAWADAARLVIARARLERFRQSADPEDLVLAREAIRRIRPDALSPRDRHDLLVGFGEALYLENLFGPAAEIFSRALDQDQPEGWGRDRLFDWWATAVDRQAQLRPGSREHAYAQIVARAGQELAGDPRSQTATYWLSAAARGAGDLDLAWDTAVAGWVRAPLTRGGGAGVRADLDRLVLEAIIPERARAQATSDADRDRIENEMRTEWTAIKERWG